MSAVDVLREPEHARGDLQHARLRAGIIERIRSGDWAPRQPIASERALCEMFGVSRTTTRRVLRDLVHEGVLRAVQGKGTFVTDEPMRQPLEELVGFSEDMRRRGLALETRVLSFERIEASEVLATALDVPPRSAVYALHRLRLTSGRPIVVQHAFLPVDLCPGLNTHDFARRSLFATLTTDYGLALARAESRVGAALADAEERRLLDLAKPAAVLRTDQTTWLSTGRVVEVCRSSFVGDGFELTSRSSRS